MNLIQTPEMHTLLAATSYLMTNYATQQGLEPLTCRTFALAQAVHQHLSLVLQHPELVAASEAQRTYQSLYQQWQLIVAEHQHSARCICEQPVELNRTAEPIETDFIVSQRTLH